MRSLDFARDDNIAEGCVFGTPPASLPRWSESLGDSHELMVMTKA